MAFYRITRRPAWVAGLYVPANPRNPLVIEYDGKPSHEWEEVEGPATWPVQNRAIGQSLADQAVKDARRDRPKKGFASGDKSKPPKASFET